jgi:hypothetical protein
MHVEIGQTGHVGLTQYNTRLLNGLYESSQVNRNVVLGLKGLTHLTKRVVLCSG